MAKKLVNIKKISHEDWIELRKRGIGGSDCACLLNMNPYSGPLTLYSRKLGLSKELEDNEAMRLGRDLEQYVAMRFVEQTGKKVINDNWFYVDDEYDFIIANIDRRIVGENAGLECKTMSSFNGYNLEAGEIPTQYYCQVQHYCMVLGFDRVYLAILVFQRGLFIATVERNDEFIAQLRQAEIDFWQKCVVPKEMPIPDGGEADLETLNELYPTATDKTELEILGLDEMIEEYKALSDLAKDYKERKEASKARICAVLGQHEAGIGQKYGCTWKNQSKTTVDTELLKTQFPEIYKQVAKVSEYRVFRTKKFKEA